MHAIPFQFVAWFALGQHARTTGLSLLTLFGAGLRGTASGAPLVFAGLHLVSLAVVAVALAVVIGRFFGRDRIDQIVAHPRPPAGRARLARAGRLATPAALGGAGAWEVKRT